MRGFPTCKELSPLQAESAKQIGQFGLDGRRSWREKQVPFDFAQGRPLHSAVTGAPAAVGMTRFQKEGWWCSLVLTSSSDAREIPRFA